MSTDVPFIKSWIPYLGHGIAFGTDADKLLLGLQQQYGDEFTILMGGKKITFLTNPHDYDTLFKQAKTLRGDALSEEVSGKAFGIQWHLFDTRLHEMTVQFDKSLRRSKLGPLTSSMHLQLEKRLQQSSSDEWQQGELFHFLAKLVFEAGGEALLGENIFDDDSLFSEFQHFDKQLPMILSGLPRWLFFRRSDQFLKKMSQKLCQPKPNQSGVMDERFAFMDSVSSDREAQGPINAGLFWAAQANTVVMAFYSVFFILRDDEARRRITQEVRESLSKVSEKTSLGTPELSLKTIDSMPLLDAALDEMLRLRTASMPIRMATENVELSLKSGKILSMKKGEYAAIFPRLTQMNSEIYEQPEHFIWDRFVGKQGPNHFNFRGEPLKYNLLPFGGGLSLCPGRHFSRNEFKVLCIVLFNAFDLELLETDLPDFDKSRLGLGALTPTSEIPFRYRRRQAVLQAGK